MWDRLGYPRRALRLHEAATVVRDATAACVPTTYERAARPARRRAVHGGRHGRLRPRRAGRGPRRQHPAGAGPGARGGGRPARAPPPGPRPPGPWLCCPRTRPGRSGGTPPSWSSGPPSAPPAPPAATAARCGSGARGRSPGRSEAGAPVRARTTRPQAWQGTDRQVRGLLLAVLRAEPGRCPSTGSSRRRRAARRRRARTPEQVVRRLGAAWPGSSPTAWRWRTGTATACPAEGGHRRGPDAPRAPSVRPVGGPRAVRSASAPAPPTTRAQGGALGTRQRLSARDLCARVVAAPLVRPRPGEGRAQTRTRCSDGPVDAPLLERSEGRPVRVCALTADHPSTREAPRTARRLSERDPCARVLETARGRRSEVQEHPGVAQGVRLDPGQVEELRDALVVAAQQLLVDLGRDGGGLDLRRTRRSRRTSFSKVRQKTRDDPEAPGPDEQLGDQRPARPRPRAAPCPPRRCGPRRGRPTSRAARRSRRPGPSRPHPGSGRVRSPGTSTSATTNSWTSS